jgi:PPOX class probable F420-dependent enzyme
MTSLLAESGRAALVTIKRDGRPQLSNIIYAHDPATGVVRISVTDTRAKTRNLRRDPRASLYLTTPNFSAYEVVEGTVELTAVTVRPDDGTADELVDLYRTISGEHPNWDEYRAAMVAEQRLIAKLTVQRSYGFAQSH